MLSSCADHSQLETHAQSGFGTRGGRNLEAGLWVAGPGDAFETRNPAHPDQGVGRYAGASAVQVDAAVRAARIAQRDWRKVPPLQRGEAVLRWLDALTLRRDEIACAIVLEQGKPLAHVRGEFDQGMAEARQMAGMAARGHGAVMSAARAGLRNMVLRRPRGLIAVLRRGGAGARARALRLGDGLQDGTTAGPPIHGAHRDKVHGMVQHGLTTALFSDSHALRDRHVHVNHGTVPDPHMRFGGIKHSGVGVHSSVGPSAMYFYTPSTPCI